MAAVAPRRARVRVAVVAVATVAALGAAACTSGPAAHDTALTTPTATQQVAPPATQSASSAETTSAPPSTGVTSSRTSARRTALGRATIVLNPGHNGDNANNPAVSYRVNVGYGQTNFCDTTGTSTVSGYPEHAFNWDVAVRVQVILEAHGVKVVMTRPNDTSAGPCITRRAAIGNRPGVTAVVSIHADGTPNGVGRGFHICEDSRPPAGPVVAAESHALTVALHNSVLAQSGFTVSTYLGHDGYYPRDDFGALNLAKVPSTFLELGNMRNAGDAAIQSAPSGRQRIARAVVDGILAWLRSR
jgi:N-acetylmuramoyl-L-alanine amidase